MWGPDPDLTDVGVTQARTARELWKSELQYGIPLPEKHYASPMKRALHTFRETFEKEGIDDPNGLRTLILEVTLCSDARIHMLTGILKEFA